MAELALPVVAFYTPLTRLPSATNAPAASAASDLQTLLLHGARYLIACHNNATNSLVSHVTDPDSAVARADAAWVQPEERQNADVYLVGARNGDAPGAETYAAVAAAFAAVSVALRAWAPQVALTKELQERAGQVRGCVAIIHGMCVLIAVPSSSHAHHGLLAGQHARQFSDCLGLKLAPSPAVVAVVTGTYRAAGSKHLGSTSELHN